MAEPWTHSEEQVLSQHFGTVEREELLRLLPLRTYPAIKLKARHMGLLHVPTEAELRHCVKAGQSLRQMGRAFDLDGKTIHRYCRQYGIVLTKQPEATSRANRNTLPPSLFLPPLDSEQSWLLGIIATDGNISYENRLRVSSVDEDIVAHCARIARCGSIYVDRKVASRARAQFTWSYTAHGTRTRLDHFGVTPDKTFTLCFPDPEDLHLPSFVRGLWDGDGYWRVTKQAALAGGFGCSSQPFIETLWEHLKTIAQSRAKVYKHPSKEHWVIRVDRQRALRLAAWMYQPPCDAYCERKREIAAPTAALPPVAVDPC